MCPGAKSNTCGRVDRGPRLNPREQIPGVVCEMFGEDAADNAVNSDRTCQLTAASVFLQNYDIRRCPRCSHAEIAIQKPAILRRQADGSLSRVTPLRLAAARLEGPTLILSNRWDCQRSNTCSICTNNRVLGAAVATSQGFEMRRM